jgi:hypothetical protein
VPRCSLRKVNLPAGPRLTSPGERRSASWHEAETSWEECGLNGYRSLI